MAEADPHADAVDAGGAASAAQAHARILRLFDVYRDYLKHEDGLINFRVTWFLATQAAIFAAYGFLAQDMIRFGSFKYGESVLPLWQMPQSFRPTPWLAVVLLLCLLGGLSSVTSFFSITAASRAMNALTWRWKNVVLKGLLTPGQDYEWLPHLKGGGNRFASVFGWLSARFLPIVSFLVWLAIAVTHLCLLPDQPPSPR